MDSFLQAIILGLVQGITEWLPVSSSGHLVLFQHFLGIEPPVVFDVMLHVGSVAVVFMVFWKDIKDLLVGIFKGDRQSWKYFSYLVVASVPIAVVGFFLNEQLKSVFSDLRLVGFSLLFTAMLLFLSKYPKVKNKSLGLRSVFLIGLAQAAAILPGVSRSGSTISVGMMQGVKRRSVAAFSFLMLVPAVSGAALLEFGEISEIGNISALLLGMLVAVVSGFLSLKVLLKIIRQGKFRYFGWYCLALGLVVILLDYV